MRDKLKAIQLSHGFLNIISHQVGAWNLPGFQTKCLFFLLVSFIHQVPRWLSWQEPKGITCSSTPRRVTATETEQAETVQQQRCWGTSSSTATAYNFVAALEQTQRGAEDSKTISA